MRAMAAFSLLLFTALGVRADDWPQWLGPKRDSGSSEIVNTWKEPLKIRWMEPVGEGHGGPVVANGKVFLHFGTPRKFEETIAAFDVDTGKQLWKYTYPRKEAKFQFGNGPRGAPCVHDGKVYTFGITSILTCVDAKDGKLLWQIDTAKTYKAPTLFFGSSCSPIVVGEHVIINVGAKGASIVAFHKDTGKEVWKTLDDGASYSSPIAIEPGGDVMQVIFLTGKGLVSLAPKDGSVFWQHALVDLLSESSTTPVVVDDILVASSITTGSIGLKLETKRAIPGVSKLWNSPLTCYFGTPVAIGKDTLYMVTGNNPLSFKKASATFRSVDAKTGKELWRRDNVGAYHASLLRTGDGKLLLVEEPGDLVLIDPDRKEYRELARSTISGNTWAHPALANGRLYIRDADNLICVEMPK
jgi:outer membrane protein assembly factor BamB